MYSLLTIRQVANGFIVMTQADEYGLEKKGNTLVYGSITELCEGVADLLSPLADEVGGEDADL